MSFSRIKMKDYKDYQTSEQQLSEGLNVLGSTQLRPMPGVNSQEQTGPSASVRPKNRTTENPAYPKYSQIDPHDAETRTINAKKVRQIYENVIQEEPSALKEAVANRPRIPYDYVQKASANYVLNEKDYYADNEKADKKTFRLQDYPLQSTPPADVPAELYDEEFLDSLYNDVNRDSKIPERKDAPAQAQYNATYEDDFDKDAYDEHYIEDDDSYDEDYDDPYEDDYDADYEGPYEDDYDDYYDEDDTYDDYEDTYDDDEPSGKTDVLAIILLIIQAILTVAVFTMLFAIHFLPFWANMVIAIVLIAVWAGIFITQVRPHERVPLIGKILSIVLCVALLIFGIYLFKTYDVLEHITKSSALLFFRKI